MKNKLILPLVVIASLPFAAGALAQQYKWVDRSGHVQYGDTPPAGVKATPLRAPSGPSAPAAEKSGGAPLSPAEQEAAFRKRQLEAAKAREKQAKADEEAAAKKENCAAAQQNLRTYESGQRIVRTDAKGERYYLDENQIAQEAARARQSVQQWCN